MIDIGRDLEIREDQKIAITRRMKDYSEIKTSESMFTRSFQGPVSSKNQALLNGYGLINSDSTFNPHKGVECSWSFDAFVKFVGRLEVADVIYKNGNPYLFQFNFYGQQKGLSTIFGADRFSDLDLSDYNHTLNYDNVKASWSGNLIGGDLLYPLIDNRRGYFFGPSNVNLAGNIANSNQSILLSDLKPAIRLPKFLSKIFELYGLTLEGDIITNISNDAFSQFLLLNRFSGQGRDPAEYDNTFSFYTDGTAPELTAVDTETIITVPTEIQDNLGLWNGTRYTASISTNHVLIFSGRVRLEGAFEFGKYTIEIRKNGVTIATSSQDDDFGEAGPFEFNMFISSIDIYLEVGEYVELFFRREQMTLAGFVYDGRDCQMYEGLLRISTPVSQIGQTASLNNQMPDLKITEWLGEFIRSLNWNLIPDDFDDTKWTLLSAEDYKAQGEVLQWDEYVDLDNIIYTKPEVYKELSFKFTESKSAIHEAYRSAARKGFGDLLIRPDIEFGKDKFEVINPCVLVPPALFKVVDSEGIPTGATVDITIHKSLDLQGGPVNEQSLLFYYNGIQMTTNPYYLQKTGTAGIVVGEIQNSYPRISSFRGNGINTNTSSLCFSVESSQNGSTPIGTLYKKYWENEIQLQFDPSTRVMKNTRLVIPPVEFYTYQLNDEIFAQGQYWRIIEINHDKDGRQAKATLMMSRRLEPLNEVEISGGGRILFERSPSKIDLGSVGAFQKSGEYFGSFLIGQITPDLLRYSEVITNVNQTVINEINEINGRFRSYSEQS